MWTDAYACGVYNRGGDTVAHWKQRTLDAFLAASMVHTAPRRGREPDRHRRRLLGLRVGAHRGGGDQGPPGRGDHRDEVRPAGRRPQHRWCIALVDRARVEDSLRRLDTDYIDLYQQHTPDYGVAPEETLAALDNLVRAGRVRVIGSSNFPAEMLVEYRHVADRLSATRMYCEQLPYNIFVRHVEPAVLPTCRRLGLGVIVWSPLNMGWLAGRYRRASGLPEDSRAARGFPGMAYAERDPVTERKLDLVEALAEVAADAGLSLNHVAHAWVLEHPAVTSAIIGPRIPSQLDESLGAADVVLDDDVLDRIDSLCPAGSDVNAHDTPGVQREHAPQRATARPALTAGPGQSVTASGG